jgi:hypothetical protein
MNAYHLNTYCFPASGIRPGRVPAKPIHSANIVLPAAPEPGAGNNLRRALFAKSRRKSLALGLIGMVFSLSLHAQTPQPGASPATGRVMFADSIKEVRTGAPLITSGASATLARSELTQTEAEAKLEFSVALKMRDFAELQQRIRNGEIVSLDEMAAKYYPATADYELVVKWLTAQGFAIKPADKYT